MTVERADCHSPSPLSFLEGPTVVFHNYFNLPFLAGVLALVIGGNLDW